jgi:hypothetical protein
MQCAIFEGKWEYFESEGDDMAANEAFHHPEFWVPIFKLQIMGADLLDLPGCWIFSIS